MFTRFTASRPVAAVPPVVVLFGWVGSSMRHVQKYAEMLTEQLGVAEVWVHIATRSSIFLRHGTAMPALARATLAELQRLAPGRPAAIYCFSNGGTFVYLHLWQELARDIAVGKERGHGARLYPDVRLVASLFDSAPSDLNMHTASRATADSLPRPWQRFVVYCVARLLMPILAVCLFPGGLRAGEMYWQGLVSDSLPMPQLYLYSKDDTIATATHVHKFVAERKRRHVAGPGAVHALFIADPSTPSPHCGHMRAHPDLYVRTVREFLEQAMREQEAAS